jgi:hypothetical protein
VANARLSIGAVTILYAARNEVLQILETRL